MKRLLVLILLLLLPLCAAADDRISYNNLISFPRNAETLDFGDVRVTDWDAFPDFLRQFPNLKKVDMFSSPIVNWRANELHDAFPDVKFGWTLRITCVLDHHQHFVRTDATAFSTLHGSKSREHNDTELAVLRYCTELRALDIGHNGVSDLSFLYDLPELRVLIVAINHISDLTPIASLKHLEYLEIFRNQITDLSPLSGLYSLKDLNIGYNMLTDISPLYSLGNLERLWLDRAAYYNYSEYGPDLPNEAEQVRLLREALPDTVIDCTSLHPTGGGWRKHPHYDAVFQTFKQGVYIPFEDSWPESGAPSPAPPRITPVPTPSPTPAPTATPAPTETPADEGEPLITDETVFEELKKSFKFM